MSERPRSDVESIIAAQPPLEVLLAGRIVRRAIVVGPLLIAIFGIARGVGGAVAAALGVALVVGNYLLTGWLLSAAARRSLTLYHAGALFGFLARLGLITGAMVLVARLVDLDRLALGLSVVVSYFSLLVLEVMRRPEEKM